MREHLQRRSRVPRRLGGRVWRGWREEGLRSRGALALGSSWVLQGGLSDAPWAEGVGEEGLAGISLA